MDKRRRLFILLAFIFSCTWLGFQIGESDKTQAAKQGALPNQSNQSTAIPTAQTVQIPSGVTGAPQEIKLLTVIYNEMTNGSEAGNANQPLLSSAWLMVYHPSQMKLFWFPLYPTQGKDNQDKEILLENHFMFQPSSNGGGSQKISEVFKEDLHQIYQIEWNGILLLKTNEVATMIDLLDGIQIDGVQRRFSGTQLFQKMIFPPNKEDPFTNQVSLLKGFCQRRNEFALQSEIPKPVIEYMFNRLSEDAYPANLNAGLVSPFAVQVRHVFSLQQDLSCEFVGVK